MAALAVVPPGDEVQRVPLGIVSDVPLRRHSFDTFYSTLKLYH